MEDEQSVALRAQQGDPEAFTDLVRTYEEVAFRVAYLIVRDEAEAADVAQEAFILAYRSLRRFDTRRPFRPWLLRIVTNQALNNRRSAGRRQAMTTRYQAEVGSDGRDSPERAAETQEESQRVRNAITQLDEQDQTVIYLRYFAGASEGETATVLGRPIGTVKSRLHRALRRLRRVIEEECPELVRESAETRSRV